MSETSPIDAKRFALMFNSKPVRNTQATAFVEQRIDAKNDFNDDPGTDFDVGLYAVVWCYFVKGKPHKYTGRIVAIEAHLRKRGFPALAYISLGKKKEKRGRWRFYNVDGLSVMALPHRNQFQAQPLRRLGNNDHFVITHTVNKVVVKAKRYRCLPQAFPRDFLYAALGEAPPAETTRSG